MNEIIYADMLMFAGTQEDIFTVGAFTDKGFRQRGIKEIKHTIDAAHYLYNMIFAYEYKVTLIMSDDSINKAVLDCLLGLLHKDKYDIDFKTGHIIPYNPIKKQAEKIDVELDAMVDMLMSKTMLTVTEANITHAIGNLKEQFNKL